MLKRVKLHIFSKLVSFCKLESFLQFPRVKQSKKLQKSRLNKPIQFYLHAQLQIQSVKTNIKAPSKRTDTMVI